MASAVYILSDAHDELSCIMTVNGHRKQRLHRASSASKSRAELFVLRPVRRMWTEPQCSVAAFWMKACCMQRASINEAVVHDRVDL